MMLLKNVHDLFAFFDAMSKCKGDVILRSMDGSEQLSMKSVLSQYVAISRLHSDHGDEYEFFCTDPADEACMLKFFYDLKKGGK